MEVGGGMNEMGDCFGDKRVRLCYLAVRYVTNGRWSGMIHVHRWWIVGQ